MRVYHKVVAVKSPHPIENSDSKHIINVYVRAKKRSPVLKCVSMQRNAQL